MEQTKLKVQKANRTKQQIGGNNPLKPILGVWKNFYQKQSPKKTQFNQKLHYIGEQRGDSRFIELMQSLNHITVMTYDSMQEGLVYNHSYFGYIHEVDGQLYAMDIRTGKNYLVSESQNAKKLIPTPEEYHQAERTGESIAFNTGGIDEELFYNYNFHYDNIAKEGLNYDLSDLDRVADEIMNFVITTNGMNDLDGFVSLYGNKQKRIGK